LDTFDFQAKDFYLKHGYDIFGVLGNCPPGHERYYMRKNLNDSEDKKVQKVTRVGVYGVVIDEGKILVVRQKRGPYEGKFDFPGGGIEFGESAELALRREFAEEVGMGFDSIQLIDNLTVTVDVSKTPSSEPYSFYQIGMIYRVNGCRLIKDEKGDLRHFWIDPTVLSEGECSKLLWKWRIMQ
jgi:ADP-ribose pyrophosphatase YjhB (NUDIX family)